MALFVNWNPALHSWVGCPPPSVLVRRLARGWEPLIRWSARDASSIAQWDTVFFMLHAAGAPVGILGRGTVADAPYLDDSWDPARPGKTQYIPIGMQSMVGVRDALPIADVAPSLPGSEWPRIPSGAPIPEDFALPIAEAWERHWQAVLHRACPFCGSAQIALEAVPPLTDSAHRCLTCGYLWGAHLDEPIVSGPEDLPAVLGVGQHEFEEYLQEFREDPELRVVRTGPEALVLETEEGEVTLTYPFLGEPFREKVRSDWIPWNSDDESDEDWEKRRDRDSAVRRVLRNVQVSGRFLRTVWWPYA